MTAANGTNLPPLADRGPLRVMFVTCSMPVGGAETLLVQLIRGLDRDRFQPELCCLKSLGPLGEILTRDTPVFSWLWKHKWDPTILLRLERLFRGRRIDAVVTVGAGDKMFWGRLAAKKAGAPVIASALHSTGWPDEIEWLNRRLNSITDAFIGVANNHTRYLIEQERLPPEKVFCIPNGVDIRRFRFLPASRARIRYNLDIAADAPVVGVVAAQRPEKNLHLFLQAAARVLKLRPETRFLLVGDGPERESLERLSCELGIQREVHFLGVRRDVPQVLSAMDVFGLTSDNEASPVSILEAMCCGLPVVATDVGSIRESVRDGYSGILTPAGDVDAIVRGWLKCIANHRNSRQMGRIGRESVVTGHSLQHMVKGYEDLLAELYSQKAAGASADLRIPPLGSVSSGEAETVAGEPLEPVG